MKDIVAFDVETTGLNSVTDYIIQIALIKLDGKKLTMKDKRMWYILPDQPFEISEATTHIHGITKESLLQDGVRLKEIADEIIEFFKGCDVLTYNGNTFDIKFLVKDMALAGKNIDLTGAHFYDSYSIEAKLAPRNLQNTYKKYMGHEFSGAHDAFNDILATCDVFRKQLETANITRKDVDSWAETQLWSTNGSIRNIAEPGKKPILVFNRGKYKDSEFIEVCQKDPSYIRWFIENASDMFTTKRLHEYCALYSKKTSKSVKK